LKDQKQKRKKGKKGHNLSWEGEKVSERGRRNSNSRGIRHRDREEEGEIYTNISSKGFHPPTLSERERESFSINQGHL